MSFDARNNSALMKRAEQLRRWEESDTNREPAAPKNEKGRKIKFSSGCVFLAACVSSDKDEVVRLLDSGADINTANVDGLTALHQACIDDNLEMVEFLVQHGADINRQDNEGWTPLHATSSCGFVSIARYLIENGVNLTAINSDGELAIDLASSDAMADYLQNLIDERDIDCQKARQQEEQLMLNDAKNWLRSDASEVDTPHPKTGATALHVAAAKGYSKVLTLLLAGRANVDKQDHDGWTPLHAAAHWGQIEAAQMLMSSMADIEAKNFAGQTAIDIAEPKIIKYLEEMRANNKRTRRRPPSQIRLPDTNDNSTETPPKVIRVEVNEVKDSLSDGKSNSELESTTAASLNKSANIDDAPWRRSGSIRPRENNDSECSLEDSEYILRKTRSFEAEKKILPAGQAAPGFLQSAPSATQIRRSFVPPVRDEESETQRKAHARNVRATRRSTQGVTLDEIKSAEELVKKKNCNNNNELNVKLEDDLSDKSITSKSFGNNDKTSTSSTVSTNLSPPIVHRKQHDTILANSETLRSVSASSMSSADKRLSDNVSTNDSTRDAVVDIDVVHQNHKNTEDKENDSRNVHSTQAVIQRRRRPKRRSTGVVQVDSDEFDPDKQSSSVTNDDKMIGTENNSITPPNSRLSIENKHDKAADNLESSQPVNYKTLWETAKMENDKLKQQLKSKDIELLQIRDTVEKLTTAGSKISNSELEKRERRAMERKLSEMEEELKLLDTFKSENQRLKEENGALIRVISKLSK